MDNARGEGAREGLDELLRRLEGTLADAVGLLAGLEERQEEPGTAAREPGTATRAEGVERRLEMVEGDRRELTSRLVDSERRGARLMTLYVATYHLHAELEPRAVLDAIAEIAVDLLGARRFALLLRDGDACRLELARGGAEQEEMFRGGRYAGGDAMLDATLADGVLRLAPAAGAESPAGTQPSARAETAARAETSTRDRGETSAPRGAEGSAHRVLAAVPLNRGDETAGVLAILDLFEQKVALTAEDRDLLDLLAAHAASALTAAELFASKERRLRTYESLIRLVGGSV